MVAGFKKEKKKTFECTYFLRVFPFLSHSVISKKRKKKKEKKDRLSNSGEQTRVRKLPSGRETEEFKKM